MYCRRLARAATERRMILEFEGACHGANEVGVTSLFPHRLLDFPWPDRPLERRNSTRDGRRHPGCPLECTHGCIYEIRLTVYDFVPVPSWSIPEDPS